MNPIEYKKDNLGVQMVLIVIALIISISWSIIPLANLMKIGPKEIIETLNEVKNNYGNR